MSRTTKQNVHKDAVVAAKPNAPAPSFYGEDAASAEWRSQQAHVDADIEGLARDPVAEKLVEDWRKTGLSSAEQRARLIAYFRNKEPASTFAAE